MDSKILKILLLLCCGACFIFMAACCGGDSWYIAVLKVKGVEVSRMKAGLWRGCSSVYGCFNYGTDVPDWFHAVRAFSIGAVLAMAGAGLLALLHIISNNMRGIIVSIFCFGSAGCMVIALSIYTNKQNNFDRFDGSPENPGWSFVLGALGAVGGVISGIIAILTK